MLQAERGAAEAPLADPEAVSSPGPLTSTLPHAPSPVLWAPPRPPHRWLTQPPLRAFSTLASWTHSSPQGHTGQGLDCCAHAVPSVRAHLRGLAGIRLPSADKPEPDLRVAASLALCRALCAQHFVKPPRAPGVMAPARARPAAHPSPLCSRDGPGLTGLQPSKQASLPPQAFVGTGPPAT